MFAPFSGAQPRAPVSYIVFASVIAALAILLSILLCFGRYQYKNIVQGVVREGSYAQVTSSIAGTVSRIYVEPKQHLRAGQPVFDIEASDSDSLYKDGKQARLIYREELEALLLTMQKIREELEVQAPNAEDSFKMALQANAAAQSHLLSAISAAGERESRIYEQVRNLETMVVQGSVRGKDLDKTQIELLESRVALSQLKKTFEQLKQNFNEMRAVQFSRQADNAGRVSSIDAQIVDIKERLRQVTSQQHTTVLASQDGQVDSILFRTGDRYSAGTPFAVLRIRQHDELELVFNVPSEIIGLIDSSQDLIVRVSSFPYETYGVLRARITNIPRAGVFAGNNEKGEKRIVFPVTARLISSPKDRIPTSSLQDGMAVSAYVSQPALSLFEWLLLPIEKAFLRNPSN